MRLNGYFFSNGNAKLGDIWNFSLPPILACPKGVPCAESGQCYALKAYRMYPGVREAWHGNYDRLLKDKEDKYKGLQDAMWQICQSKKPRHFRIHVAGDFISQSYFTAWRHIAMACRSTEFLAFTKVRCLNLGNMPANFHVKFSAWPGLELPAVIPPGGIAWMRDTKNPDPRIPEEAHPCGGSCDECHCKYCWHTDRDVVFDIH